MNTKIQSGNFSREDNIIGIFFCEIKSKEQFDLPENLFPSFNFILKNGNIGRISSVFQEKHNGSIRISIVFNEPKDRNASIATFDIDTLLSMIKDFI